MSIANQRQMLADYVMEKGWNLIDTYIDDGFSGTDFDRPDFKRLLRDISEGLIDCVITKDLSRLGRNYAKVGYYTEEFFVENGIRFIAINDSVDTLRDEENELAPFKNVLNEWYPRDISKKVRQVKRSTARQGKFIGSYAPYGYEKKADDIHSLVIDEFAADVVRRIFNEYALGSPARNIAEGLNRDGFDCPRYYNNKKKGQTINPHENNNWGSGTILAMMRNEVYIGHMVQGKYQMVSFKSKKKRAVDPDKWYVVKNTHEPIISEELWDRVQKQRAITGRRSLTRTGDVSLFATVLRCQDCGSKLIYSAKGTKARPVGAYRCARYTNNGSLACTQHYIKEETLINIVLRDVRDFAALALKDREKIRLQLLSSLNQSQNLISKAVNKEIRDYEKRSKAVEETIKQLYEDKVSGKIPLNVFSNLLNGYMVEQQKLDQASKEARRRLDELLYSEEQIDDWLDMVSCHLDIADLDRTTLMELVETIVVSERYKVNDKKHQDIKINYRFIADLPSRAKKDIASLEAMS